MELAQITEQRKKHTLFYWLFAIMLGMVAFRNVFHIEFPIVLFLGVVTIIAMFCDKDDIIAIAIACIPLSTAFQYKYALFICIILYCIRFSNDVRITGKVIPIVLMFFWEIFHIGMGSFSWIELLRSFAELIFLAFLFSVSEEEFDLTYICRIFSFTTVIICFFILLIQLEANSYDFSELFSGTFRFGAADEEIENFGLNFNENGLGGVCNLAIIGTLLIADNSKMRLFDIIIIGLLAIFGTMTMSRTFIVCFAIIIIYYFFFQTGNFDKKTARVVGIIIIGLLSLLVLYIIVPQVIESFIERFSEDDISNGRIELFEFYNKHITSSPIYTLFGIGLQDIPGKISSIHSTFVNVCHNGFQEIVVVWGVFGIVLFTALIYCIIVRNPNKHIVGRNIRYGPLFLLLVSSISGQLITKGISLLGLAFAYLCINNNFTSINNDFE